MSFLKDTLVFHLGQSVFSKPQILKINKFIVSTDRTADPFERLFTWVFYFVSARISTMCLTLIFLPRLSIPPPSCKTQPGQSETKSRASVA